MFENQNITTPFDQEIQILLCRGRLYELLSFLFSHPLTWDSVPLNQTKEAVYQRAAFDLPDNEHTDSLRSSLNAILIQLTANGLSQTEISGWYDLCFSPMVRSPASPYETEYGHFFIREASQLADACAFYEAFGFKPSPRYNERQDHISIQTAFMSILCLKEAFALLDNKDEQASVCRHAAHTFMNDHLGRWSLSFAKKLMRAAPHEFYRQAGRFLYNFIQTDRHLLGLQPGRDDLPLKSVDDDLNDFTCARCTEQREAPS